MFHYRRTPLAWKNLTHDYRRLLIAVSGVTFAVVLMFMERGFQNALFDSTVELVKHLDADIIINCTARYSLSSSGRFPADMIPLARGCDGVASVHPVFIENYLAVVRKPNHRSRPIRVVGLDMRSDLFTADLQPSIDRYRHLLLAPNTAIIDVTSKQSIYEIDPTLPSPKDPLAVFLADKQLSLIGTFQLGTDFANDGTLLMSQENFAHYFSFRVFPGSPLSEVDLALVNCSPDADVGRVRKCLERTLGANVSVRTRARFIEDEIAFWDENTPIGIIFQVGVLMGFVVGVLICYQVLFNDITDHMPEFATLMAMGYSSRYFVLLVVREAVYLALFGFLPGLLISWGLFAGISAATGLTMTLKPFEIVLVLAFTVIMCVLSGLFAVRKLLAADPASLF